MKKIVLFLCCLVLWPMIAKAQASAKVCLASIGVAPDGKIVLLEPCRIVASVPFSFSKEDYDIYGKMLNAISFAMTFMTEEAQYPQNNHDSDKALIATAVKGFREQRRLFCARHPEMAVFNLYEVAGGPEFTESYPESCRSDDATKSKSE